MMLGLALPALAYHIDNAEQPGAAADLASSNDFVIGSSFLIVCEREYGAGFFLAGGPVPADDRNGNGGKTPSGTHFGDGGLCTTGRNDASGEPAPHVKLGKGNYTRLDACNNITVTRNGGLGSATYGPYNATSGPDPGGAPCYAPPSMTPGADTNDHWWTFELGAFVCEIPTSGSPVPMGPFALANYAAYYDEKYAEMTFDGSGFYTAADAPGEAHGSAAGVGVNGRSADTPTFTTPVGANNVDAWHGHAAMFIDTARSASGFSLRGSAETALAAAGQTAGVWAINEVAAGIEPANYDSNCGGATGFTGGAFASATVGGPVFRACYIAGPVPAPLATQTCFD